MKTKSFFAPLIIVLLTFALSTISSNAQEDEHKKNDSKTTSFLIKLPHTSEECLKAIDEVKESKPELLNKIEWAVWTMIIVGT